LKLGLFKVVYQVGIEVKLKTEPTTPANCVPAIEINNFG